MRSGLMTILNPASNMALPSRINVQMSFLKSKVDIPNRSGFFSLMAFSISSAPFGQWGLSSLRMSCCSILGVGLYVVMYYVVILVCLQVRLYGAFQS